MKNVALILGFLVVCFTSCFAQEGSFEWPEGIKMGLSLTFDDARLSQVDVGTPLFDQYDVKATFVVVPSNVEMRLEKWKEAARNGHEIGNHTLRHPCSGNFVWSREKALENYSLNELRRELIESNQWLESTLNIKSTVFAYPCGSTFVGRGINTESYVPLIAELFEAGRGWLDEAPNDPTYCDFAQLTGMEMDGKDFDQILPLIENAQKTGSWLVLAGHEITEAGNQTTKVSMLRKLIEYAKDPKNGIWIAPMGEIAEYVKKNRVIKSTPKIINAETDGSYLLSARFGKGVGPNIEYMPEWKAFGWFTADDYVEWDLEVEKSGLYEVELEWSVSDEEAGKKYLLEIGDFTLKKKIKKTGSWETYKKKVIGQVQLNQGSYKVKFSSLKKDSKGALLDLRMLKLSPR